MRTAREDVSELIQEIRALNETTFEDASSDGIVAEVARALDTARNCIENLAGEVEDLTARLAALERSVR